MSDFLGIIDKKWRLNNHEEVYELVQTQLDNKLTSLTRIREIITFCDKRRITTLLINAYEKLLVYDLNELDLAKYLKYIKGSNNEVHRLKLLAHLDNFFEYETASLMVCKRLIEICSEKEGYVLALKISEYWASSNVRNKVKPFSFIQIELLIINYEYQQKKWKAARNRLCHLLSLNIEISGFEEQLAYWAMLLDEMDVLIHHSKLNQILSNCPVEYSIFIHSYRYLLHGVVKKELLLQLQTIECNDTPLSQKMKCFVFLLRYILGEKLELNMLQQVEKQYEHDVYFQLVLVNVGKPYYGHIWKKLINEHGDLKIVLKAYASHLPNVRKPQYKGLDIEFLGGGERIGGTGIVLSYKGQKLLLDAGMYLDREEYLTNFSQLHTTGGLNQLDGVVISHAHLDHTGSLPYIKKMAPKVPIYMTFETNQIFGHLIRTVIKRSKIQYYNEYDLICTENEAITQSLERTFSIVGSNGTPWNITFYEAGHVIGAAAIHIVIDEISILFTGDYALEEQRHCGQLKLPANLPIDILITESTYGYRPKIETLSKTVRESLLIESIERTIEKGGSFLIPTFSLGRAQEVLEIIQSNYENQSSLPFNLIIDGNVVQMTTTYNKLKKDSRELLNRAVIPQNLYHDQSSFNRFYDMYVKDGGACIIASSGMLHKGSASYLYAQKMLPFKQHTIALTGYLDPKSPAAAIYQKRYQKGEAVMFADAPLPLEATIEMHHFSAHVMQKDLIDFVLQTNPSQVVLMHGEHSTLYNPYNLSEDQAQRMFMPVDLMLKHLEIPYILAENGKKYHFGR